jgi:hypothetical protein
MIVGIGYKKRRGKDTAADALVRDLGFVKVGFADALKDLALEANPVIQTEPGFQNVRVGHNTLRYVVERTGWDYAKDHYPEVRSFLQRLGEGARKTFGEDFWVQVWHARAYSDQHDVVIPDVRYLNEAMFVKKFGGFLIRINRARFNEVDPHSSETQLDEFDRWDATIDNSSGVVDLEREIVEIVRNAQYSNTSSAEKIEA